jgi:hypothetical protein
MAHPLKSFCVVDFNFYRGIDDVLVVKELAVFAPLEHCHQMWIFQAPYPEHELSKPTRTYNNKNLKPLLQINWEAGDVPYSSLHTILANSTIKFSEVYVCGKEKSSFISDALMRGVINFGPTMTQFERLEKYYKADLQQLRGEHRCQNHIPTDKCPIAARDRFGLFPRCMHHLKLKNHKACAVVNCDRISFPVLMHKMGCEITDPMRINLVCKTLTPSVKKNAQPLKIVPIKCGSSPVALVMPPDLELFNVFPTDSTIQSVEFSTH